MTSKNTAGATFVTKYSTASVIAGVLMLLASGVPQAKEHDNNECSAATLNGPPGGAGSSYTVAPDCTGKIVFGPGPTFDFFIGFRESELYMIQTNPNTVFQGIAERISR